MMAVVFTRTIKNNVMGNKLDTVLPPLNLLMINKTSSTPLQIIIIKILNPQCQHKNACRTYTNKANVIELYIGLPSSVVNHHQP